MIQKKHFIDIEKLLKVPPFYWQESDAYYEWKLLSFNPVSPALCSQPCPRITFIGQTYSHEIIRTDSDSEILNTYRIPEIGDYLETQGYSLENTTEKGPLYIGTYQKVLGNAAQIISIQSSSISLDENWAGIYGSDDGTRFELFVSSIFKVPEEGVF